MSGITASMVGLSNVANTAPSDLPVSTATISMIAGVNGQITSNLLYITQTNANLINPIFTSNVDILGGLNVTGTTIFYGTVTGIPMPTLTSLGLFNVANTRPSDLPISNAVTNALYQCAQLTNPSFNGVVSMQGLKLYGVAGGSPIFDVGMVQHNNRLKFSIASSYTMPSDLETKFAIDSAGVYLSSSTYCTGDITFFRGC